MNLTTFAERAWQTAEDKGLHTTLDTATTLGTREQALLALIPLSLTLTTLVQTIKRQGVSLPVWDTNLFALERDLRQRVETTFDTLLRLCDTAVPALAIATGDTTAATAIRLLLIGTEVGEALENLSPHPALPDAERQSLLCREIMDIMVRCADTLRCLGGDITALATAVLDANAQRPYGYGTPLQHHSQGA